MDNSDDVGRPTPGDDWSSPPPVDSSSSAIPNPVDRARNYADSVAARTSKDDSRGSIISALPWILVAGLGIALWLRGNNRPSVAPRTITPAGNLAEDEKSTIELFQQASQSVAFITTSVRRRTIFEATEHPKGTGTGFVWDEHGHVVTNFHVVENANRFYVTLSDQTVLRAELVGKAPDKDLAVLKLINAPTIPSLKIGESSNLLVGQKVFAIGNPFGFDQTLTTGVISGLRRVIKSRTQRQIKDVIQTDAAINPGNSGGPLLDSNGRLIGVNTAIFSPSGAYAGIGFAIPVDTVNHIVPQLIAHGRVIRPGLGIAAAPDRLIRQLMRQTGVLILDVQKDGPAFHAGIRPTLRDNVGRYIWGDVIIGAEGKPISDFNQLYSFLDEHKAGETVTLRIRRGIGSNSTKELDVEVTLGESMD